MKYDFIFELPFWDRCCGGVAVTVDLARELKKLGHRTGVWFQNRQVTPELKDICVPGDFPYCHYAVTYTDTGDIAGLRDSGRAGQVILLMLGFGLCPARERTNMVSADRIWCSSKKIQDLITAAGYRSTLIGHGHYWDRFYPTGLARDEKRAVVLLHNDPLKRYSLAINICRLLFEKGLISSVSVFGSLNEGEEFYLPIIGKTYRRPTHDELRLIFSSASVYIMPSVCEGFNLTPAEATLCGCPAVICDGAIGELYHGGKTCMIAQKDDADMFTLFAEQLLLNPSHGKNFRVNMQETVKEFTWEKVCKKIKEDLCL